MVAACTPTTGTYRIGFVQAIPVTGAAPTTVMDLNDGTWCLGEGTRFDPPDIDRAVVETLLTDGASYPATVYRNRVLQLRLTVQTASADALATQLQLLFRQLDKPRNILLYQPKTTNPVYFRTFRASAKAIDVIKQSQSTALVNVDLPAEPFGYGPKQILTPISVANDPASGNGCYFDLATTDVIGDVETPAQLQFLNPGTTDNPISVLGIRRRGTPSQVPHLLQAESMTMNSADTTVQAHDTAMSGTGNNFIRCTFATTTAMTNRAYKNPHPTSDVVDTRGTYRVFARVRRSGIAATITMRMEWGQGTLITGDTYTLPAHAGPMVIDLGLITLPATADPVYDGYSGTELNVRGGTVGFAAARSGAAENLDVDYLFLMPADDELALIDWSDGGGVGSDLAVIDGPTEAVYNTTPSGSVERTNSAIGVVGGFLKLSPNTAQRVYFLRSTGDPAAGGSDSTTATTSITVAYWPRYLRVRPVST